MEKYGVDTEEQKGKDKIAQDDLGNCPLCGEPLESLDQTGQRKCPTHGTEPFEDQQ